MVCTFKKKDGTSSLRGGKNGFGGTREHQQETSEKGFLLKNA